MSVNNKRILSTIVYYSLIVLALASAGFFIFALVIRALPMWAKVLYYIWTGFVIGAIIFDIVCTYTSEAKQISGFIIYALSVISVIMMIVLYAINATRTGLAADFFNVYLTSSVLSLMLTGYTIAIWCVGESLVEHAVSQKEINKRTK